MKDNTSDIIRRVIDGEIDEPVKEEEKVEEKEEVVEEKKTNKDFSLVEQLRLKIWFIFIVFAVVSYIVYSKNLSDLTVALKYLLLLVNFGSLLWMFNFILQLLRRKINIIDIAMFIIALLLYALFGTFHFWEFLF